ncbi:cytochrome oxidase assembly protein [Perilla frutescens var. hirtella]|nr:cytochrome oxidase assembly protein [Perilla frutescens var. frutescens]KAH6786577.1 cytochrome oxidase assembly protein [Perilla frutescens var. hirtella]
MSLCLFNLLQGEHRLKAVYPDMSGISGFRALAPKTKNMVVAGGLSAFVFGVYFYTMRAVGGTDELQVAIDKFEEQKHTNEQAAALAPKT